MDRWMSENEFINTGAMCMVHVNENGVDRVIDLGNYYCDKKGERVLITSVNLAELYARFVNVPVYVFRGVKDAGV